MEVVPTLHGSVLQGGGEELLCYEVPAVNKLVTTGRTLAQLGLAGVTDNVT